MLEVPDLSRLSVSRNPPPSPSSKLFEHIDFSRLSVPENPPPSTVDMLEPMNLFANYGGSWSEEYTRRRGFKPSGADPTYHHLIEFDGYNFTVDGGPEQNAKDPKHEKFLESIKNHRIPEEFAGDGKHKIEVVRACKLLRGTTADDVPDENYEEYRKLIMSIRVDLKHASRGGV